VNYGSSGSDDLEEEDEDSEEGYDTEENKESTEGFVPTGEEVSEERRENQRLECTLIHWKHHTAFATYMAISMVLV
jgi:hypothetical protein